MDKPNLHACVRINSSRYNENSEDDLVIADLDEQSTVRMPVLTFVPDDQIAEVTVQAHTI